MNALDDADGRRCACGHAMALTDVVIRRFTVLADDMYDRGPSPLACSEEHCPECDSTDLHPLWLCERCGLAASEEGSDYCAACDVIAEREECAAIRRASAEERSRELLETLVDIARGVQA